MTLPHNSASRSQHTSITFPLPSLEMVSSVLLLTAAFASYASAARVLLGFRTVCQAEAEAINSRGWVYWDPSHPSAKYRGMLGTGKSHSNKVGLWEGNAAGNIGGDWFCYTTGEDSLVKSKVVKIWINPIEKPKASESTYPFDETKIQSILRGAGAKKPDQTLRLGQIDNGEELLIPAASLPGPTDEDGGLLDLETYCFATKEAMFAHMKANGITATEADYDSATFTSKYYKIVDQKKRDTIGEEESERERETEAASGRVLRFMPRVAQKDPNVLELAKGYTITLKVDPKGYKFPAPKAEECPVKPTLGKKPKVVGGK